MEPTPDAADPSESPGLGARALPDTLPPPLQGFELTHPAVPPGLDGFRILHIADLHARARSGLRGPRRPRATNALLAGLRGLKVDLACLTGDYADRAGDGQAAADLVLELVGAIDARLGVAGSFGNHDHQRARDQLRRRVPAVRWLDNAHADIAPLRLIGTGEPEDLLAATLSGPPDGTTDGPPRFTIALAHDPIAIFPASDLSIPLVLSGHTHGGQIRTGPRRLFHTSTDLRGHEATGAIARRDTICCITRGIGVTVLALRINCPPQACVYTLRTADNSRPARERPEDATLRTLLAW
ncbi:MAG: metallophosphoesterase [Planctomycetota bacterium]